MLRFFCLFASVLLLLTGEAAAQVSVNYPYNPDSNGNGLIDAEDLLAILANFGIEFTPSTIDVDGMTLEEYLIQLNEVVLSLQLQVDSLPNQTGFFGVVDVQIESDGSIVFEFTDGSTVETPILVGPPGEPGPPGPQGETGPPGDVGPAGPQGETGPVGPAGEAGASAYELWLASGFQGSEADFLAELQGETGPMGPQGPAGPAGAQGEQGPAGAQGEEGPAGPAGPQGEPGPAGPAGAQGEEGPAGPAGPQGEPGPTGPQGEMGQSGLDGASSYDLWLTQGNSGSLSDYFASLRGEQGPQGEAGPAGPQGEPGSQGEAGPAGLQGEPGPQGEQGPAGPQGEMGQPGLDGASSYDLWLTQGNSGSLSDYFASLRGDQGPQGEVGPAGPQGEAGPAGPQGEQGPQGEPGPAGPQGEPGPQGEAGPAGPQGEQGPQGEPGPAGPQGPQGPQGDPGLPTEGLAVGSLLLWNGSEWVAGGTAAVGCLDPSACNYDATAAISDSERCVYVDACGICDGPGEVYECGCADIPAGDCDCDGNQTDALGVCGGGCSADADGDGICDDGDTCIGQADECGVCNGPGAVYECGCSPIPEGDCNCSGTPDADGDGICDDSDDCVGTPDAIGVCNGDCTTDADGDGICDDNGGDPCDGSLDICGVCNGPGPVYDCGCEPLQEGACDCAGNLPNEEGLCPDFLADNDGDGIYDEVVDPCLGETSLTYHDHTYALVAIGNRCWFKENLATTLNRDGWAICDGSDFILEGCFDDVPYGAGILTVTGGFYPSEVSWVLTDANGTRFEGGVGTYQLAPFVEGEFVFEAYDSWGDGWNGATATLTWNGSVVMNQFTFPTGFFAVFNGTAAGSNSEGGLDFDGHWNEIFYPAFARFGNADSLVSTHGQLYNGYATMPTFGLCPAQWEVPSSSDWQELASALGGMAEAGGALKESGTSHWLAPNTGATNSSGFTALPSGQRQVGTLGDTNLGEEAWFWSNTWMQGANSLQAAWGMSHTSSQLNTASHSMNRGHSVRCILEPAFLGCTNSGYLEFNPDANLNDGSCQTLIVLGCTNPLYEEYSATANVDDGSCLTLPGCGPSDFISYQEHDYDLVAIGDQCWFKENLQSTHFADGTSILEIQDGGEWSALSASAQCVYGNDLSNVEAYGRLYNWFAVDDERGLCPTGWHVPTDAEYTELTDHLGGQLTAGIEMKSAPEDNPSWDGTNASGFSGLPGGERNNNGYFINEGDRGSWWSATDGGYSSSYVRSLNSGDAQVLRGSENYRQGLSVRCVRD